jgi:DNA repair exonuclease SbcCD ATPase subunit
MEKRIQDIEDSVKEIAKYVRNESMRIEELIEKSPDREYLERMEKAKEEIDSNLRILQLLKQDIEAMRSETEDVEKRIRKLEEKTSSGHSEALAGNIENRLDFVERELKESVPTREILEEENVMRASIQKKLQEMEKRFGDLINRDARIDEPIKKVLEEEISQRKKIEKKLQEMENRFEDLGNMSRITDAQGIEPALILRLQGLENRLRNMEEEGPKAVPVGDARLISLERRLETMEKFNEPVREFDKKLELKVSRYLSDQLENFAKALDKRLPNFALIEDYNKALSSMEKRINELESSIKADVDRRLSGLNHGMRSVEEKIKTVESPDLSPLANRVALLEKRMVEIIALMKSFLSRMPVVVE